MESLNNLPVVTGAERSQGFSPDRLPPSPGSSPGLAFSLVNNQRRVRTDTSVRDTAGSRGWGWGGCGGPSGQNQPLRRWSLGWSGLEWGPHEIGWTFGVLTTGAHGLPQASLLCAPCFPASRAPRSQRGVGRELEGESEQGPASASAHGAPGNGWARGRQLLKVWAGALPGGQLGDRTQAEGAGPRPRVAGDAQSTLDRRPLSHRGTKAAAGTPPRSSSTVTFYGFVSNKRKRSPRKRKNKNIGTFCHWGVSVLLCVCVFKAHNVL